MKKKTTLSLSVFWVALITLLVLSIPLIAMQFSAGVQWSVADFIVMGVLIFTTGFSYVLLTKSSHSIIHKAAVALAIVSTFLLVWVNLAVGLIGSGPNAANLMYAGIVAIVIAGSFIAGFTSKGMQRLMTAVAITLALFVLIQLAFNMQNYPDSYVMEIISVNGFFALLFGISALLFRYTIQKQLTAGNNHA